MSGTIRHVRSAAQLVVLALGCAASGASAADQPSFFDNFDKLDAARWFVSDGWTNGDWQNCGWSKQEVSLSGGYLNVGFSKNPAAGNRSYRCGELQTHQSYGYGTFEARLKTPPEASGMNAAFFTYIGPPNGNVHDEIDFETLLKDPTKVSAGAYVSGKAVTPGVPSLPASADSAFVDYAFVWAPGSVKYYINGKLAHTLASPSPTPVTPQHIFFSLWGSNSFQDWMGPFTDPGKPLNMQVDWVAYTAPNDHCLFPESITCAQK